MKIVTMSTGAPIPIDDDEVPIVVAKMVQRKVVMVKQGVINTAYVVSISEDHERANGWNRDIGQGKYLPTSTRPLHDVFSGLREEIKNILKPAENARLNKTDQPESIENQ